MVKKVASKKVKTASLVRKARIASLLLCTQILAKNIVVLFKNNVFGKKLVEVALNSGVYTNKLASCPPIFQAKRAA
jgi:hypothetical protein